MWLQKKMTVLYLSGALLAWSRLCAAQTLSNGCYLTSSIIHGGTFNSFSSMTMPTFGSSGSQNQGTTSSSLIPTTLSLATSATTAATMSSTSATPALPQFYIEVNTGNTKARRDIEYVGFDGDTSVLVTNKADAALFVLTSDGYLMSGGQYVGASDGPTGALTKLSSPPAEPFPWTFNGTTASFGDTQFCTLSDGQVVAYTSIEPMDCSSVVVAAQAAPRTNTTTKATATTSSSTEVEVTITTTTTTMTATTIIETTLQESSSAAPTSSQAPPPGSSHGHSSAAASSSSFSASSALAQTSTATSAYMQSASSSSIVLASSAIPTTSAIASTAPAVSIPGPSSAINQASSPTQLIPISSISTTSDTTSTSASSSRSRRSSSTSSLTTASLTTTKTTSSPPTPTPNPYALTGKRGLAYTNVSTLQFYPPPTQVSWSYNYYSLPNASDNVGLYPYTTQYPLKFYPLLFSDNAGLTKIWFANVNYSIANYGTDAIFSFNEPDACFGGLSSCMNVSRALSAYQSFIQPFAGRVLLGAPAITNAGSGFVWLSQFLGNATQLKLTIDFINMHWYASPYNEAYFESYMAQAQQVAAAAGYPNMPVWITEYGMDKSTYVEPAVLQFLRNTTYWVDVQSDGFVPKTCWFGNFKNNLLNTNGTARSAMGDIWNNPSTGYVYGFSKRSEEGVEESVEGLGRRRGQGVGMKGVNYYGKRFAEAEGGFLEEWEVTGGEPDDTGDGIGEDGDVESVEEVDDSRRGKWNWKDVGTGLDEKWLSIVRGEVETS